MHRYFKNYRNHSQALKVVLYEDSKVIQYQIQSIYKNMRQSNSNFKFLLFIIAVLEKIKFRILKCIHCMKMIRNTINL